MPDRKIARVTLTGLAAVLALSASACHRQEAAKAPADARINQLAVRQIDVKEPGALTLSSTAFAAGGAIPDQHSAYARNVSPPLSWVPDRPAKAYALIVEDPDAPTPRPFVHWVAWNIAANVHDLPLGISEAPSSTQPMMQGNNGMGAPLWYGPHPPKGPPHHYHFQLFALDAPLALPGGADRDAVVKAMQGHVLAMGDLVATYQAPGG